MRDIIKDQGFKVPRKGQHQHQQQQQQYQQTATPTITVTATKRSSEQIRKLQESLQSGKRRSNPRMQFPPDNPNDKLSSISPSIAEATKSSPSPTSTSTSVSHSPKTLFQRSNSSGSSSGGPTAPSSPSASRTTTSPITSITSTSTTTATAPNTRNRNSRGFSSPPQYFASAIPRPITRSNTSPTSSRKFNIFNTSSSSSTKNKQTSGTTTTASSGKQTQQQQPKHAVVRFATARAMSSSVERQPHNMSESDLDVLSAPIELSVIERTSSESSSTKDSGLITRTFSMPAVIEAVRRFSLPRVIREDPQGTVETLLNSAHRNNNNNNNNTNNNNNNNNTTITTSSTSTSLLPPSAFIQTNTQTVALRSFTNDNEIDGTAKFSLPKPPPPPPTLPPPPTSLDNHHASSATNPDSVSPFTSVGKQTAASLTSSSNSNHNNKNSKFGVSLRDLSDDEAVSIDTDDISLTCFSDPDDAVPEADPWAMQTFDKPSFAVMDTQHVTILPAMITVADIKPPSLAPSSVE